MIFQLNYSKLKIEGDYLLMRHGTIIQNFIKNNQAIRMIYLDRTKLKEKLDY
jgi:hypothetical protein